MHPLVAGIVALLLAASAGELRAATFTVNSLADTDDGTCGAAAGGCTLHEAMAAAVATLGRDTIGFDPAVFPPGAPGVIDLFQVTPVIADPAGTVLDGSGAGVIIEPANLQGPSADPLVFASAAGVPLADVAVANVAVRGFVGSGIVICGGEYPGCAEDVSGTIVQNVVANSNGVSGIKIKGRNVAKLRLVDDVVRLNTGIGIAVDASQSLTATRMERCTARDNGMQILGEPGIRLNAGGDLVDTMVKDSIAVHNASIGIQLIADADVRKTKMTGVTALRNSSFGVVIHAGGDLSSTTISDTIASNNLASGIVVDGGTLLSGTTVKDVAANGNGGRGIELGVSFHLTSSKITNAKAAGNGSDGITVFSGVDATGAQISRSIVTNNGGIGLMVMGTKNVIKGVRADGNGAGIHLDAPGGGSKIEKCVANANNGVAGGEGIAVAMDSTGNLVQGNSAFLNDGFDLLDGNPNCDANTWKKNASGGRSATCIE